jgi:prepilin-type N-terminal cleavage/methylation domain-containing protein
MSINHLRRLRSDAKGFTIVELMIATAVFGTVLLIVTIAILQFTRVYYKGATQANTQDTARAVMDRISQAIQFNGGTVTQTPASPSPGSSYAFCIGNQQYSFTTGTQLVDSPTSSQTYHALVVNDAAGCTSSTPAQNVRGATVSGRELLAPKMRLSKIEVTNVGTNLYKVSVRVVFGDDDLLSNPTGANAACKGTQGTQFCAVSDITTVVTKRVE